MPDIILAAINARYTHSAFGIRSILANLGPLRKRAALLEYVSGTDIREMAALMLECNPKIIGISVSIWNALESSRLLSILKQVSPETVLIAGGPEVSHRPLRVDFTAADYIISGEGETIFRKLCMEILGGVMPEERLIHAAVEDLEELELPYEEYSDLDLANRVTYVESARGCPFHCKFCLSSVDHRVRYFNTVYFLDALENLWERGARNFKFIDRTFNLDMVRAGEILDFFLGREPPFLVHFEVVPDNFPEQLKERLRLFPPKTLQLEIGIQTLDPVIGSRIGREIDSEKIAANLSFLEKETNAHLHIDLIIGLPGESVSGFSSNLDRLLQISGGEIQLGVLKKLSGTELGELDDEFGMVWDPDPPYTVLRTDLIPFGEMQELLRMARFWDIVYNSGNFRTTVQLLLQEGQSYRAFREFSSWLFDRTGAVSGISLNRLARFLFNYLIDVRGYDADRVAESLSDDLIRATGKRPPPFLRLQTRSGLKSDGEGQSLNAIPRRQRKRG